MSTSWWVNYVTPFFPLVYVVAGLVKRFAADHTIAYKIADSIMTGGTPNKVQ